MFCTDIIPELSQLQTQRLRQSCVCVGLTGLLWRTTYLSSSLYVLLLLQCGMLPSHLLLDMSWSWRPPPILEHRKVVFVTTQLAVTG